MIKKLTILPAILVTLLFTSNLIAQDSTQIKKQNRGQNKVKVEQKTQLQHGTGFVDADGDGYNDNAPDHDGDGIPNGLDPDFTGKNKKGFVDLDGDGINDNAGFNKGKGNKNGFNRSNSGGNLGKGPQGGNVSGIGNNASGENGGGNHKKTKGKGKGGH